MKKVNAAKPVVKKEKGDVENVLKAFERAGKGGFKFQITKDYERELAAAGHKRAD